MLSHDNYTWVGTYFNREKPPEFGNSRLVSYLPLSHVAA